MFWIKVQRLHIRIMNFISHRWISTLIRYSATNQNLSSRSWFITYLYITCIRFNPTRPSLSRMVCNNFLIDIISMLTHWSYIFLALTHRYNTGISMPASTTWEIRDNIDDLVTRFGYLHLSLSFFSLKRKYIQTILSHCVAWLNTN